MAVEALVVLNYNFLLVTGALFWCPRVVFNFLDIFYTIYEEVGSELFRPGIRIEYLVVPWYGKGC